MFFWHRVNDVSTIVEVAQRLTFVRQRRKALALAFSAASTKERPIEVWATARRPEVLDYATGEFGLALTSCADGSSNRRWTRKWLSNCSSRFSTCFDVLSTSLLSSVARAGRCQCRQLSTRTESHLENTRTSRFPRQQCRSAIVWTTIVDRLWCIWYGEIFCVRTCVCGVYTFLDTII